VFTQLFHEEANNRATLRRSCAPTRNCRVLRSGKYTEVGFPKTAVQRIFGASGSVPR
jgi:hypothetical protein